MNTPGVTKSPRIKTDRQSATKVEMAKHCIVNGFKIKQIVANNGAQGAHPIRVCASMRGTNNNNSTKRRQASCQGQPMSEVQYRCADGK